MASGKDDPYGTGPIYFWGGWPLPWNSNAVGSGATMYGTTSVYVIFYGNGWSSFTKTQLQDYLRHMGGSTWWGLNKQYGVGNIHLGGYYQVPATSNLLGFNDLVNVVVSSIDAKASSWHNVGLGNGTPGDVYVVLTDSTVDVGDSGYGSGFCTQYCGYHSAFYYNNKDIKFAWVGDASRCPSVVGYSSSLLNPDNSDSPNGSFQFDSMVNVLSHELAEMTSDPLLDTWFDGYGNENADKCVWDFGSVSKGTSTNPNGYWNERVGTFRYLIQENWNLASQTCTN